MKFKNKVVVVTGASRGIGQAICVAFARKAQRSSAWRAAIWPGPARRCKTPAAIFIAHNADLGTGTQKESDEVIAQILAKTGRIDALINNAGIIRRAPAKDFSEADWNAVMATNLNSPFFLMQAAGKWWIETGRAKAAENSPAQAGEHRVVAVVSRRHHRSAYAASKHGIAGVTKALANEWAKERINVNAIAPGYIATENTRALREDPVRNKAILDRIPEGRWGNAADIAGGCVFLAAAIRII